MLEYHFPAYTGLPPRKIEPGGDVAAIQGTEVLLHVVPTMTTPGGRILLNDGESRAADRQADGTLAGNFKVDKQGFYRIELEGPQGEKVNASPQYTIDVLADQPPSVSFAKPGRDTTAKPVEEVFAEVRADDDFGVKQLQMFYSVNGGAEKTITLFGGAKPLPEVTAGHTIYLEELGLKPGDFVSYYAKATDNDGPAGEDRDERHLLRPDPAVPQGLQAGAVDGRRRRRRRRRQRGRPAVAAAARDRRGDVQHRPRQRRRSRPRSSARTSCSSRLRRRGCASRSRS